MPFVFKKILDHGTSHPVVARLQLQVRDLLNATAFDEPKRQAIFEASFNASLRLLRCYDFAVRLESACEKCEQEHKPTSNPQAASMPYVIGLEHDAETFLYEIKNFLREQTVVINTIFGTKFAEASEFFDARGNGDGQIAKWAFETFGPEARLGVFLQFHKDWIGEVIRMRNAIEHPGGYSGRMNIRNYETVADGTIRRPVWFRNDAAPSAMIEDMEGLCEHLLVFAEELIVLAVQMNLAAPMLEVLQIPEGQRDPTCPKRFVVSLSNEVLEKLKKAPQSGGLTL